MSLASRISIWNRQRKWALFLDEFSPDETLRVLDVGFSKFELAGVSNVIEQNYPFPEKLTALGTDDPRELKRRYRAVDFVRYDGGRFPFADQHFDACWSNAVIEHVGDEERQLFFLSEMRRVARRCFLTTPNRYFPIEVHTLTPLLHYLPREWFHAYLRRVGKQWAAGDFMHLLSPRDMRRLLARAGIEDYKIHRNRLAGFVMDFVVIFPAHGDDGG